MALQNPFYRWLSLCISPLYSFISVFIVSSWMESPWWLELRVCISPKVCSQDIGIYVHSIQFSSVAQSCLTLCNLKNCSTPGLPVHHQIPGSTQTHVHWVSDPIQLFHPLSSPSTFNLFPSIRVFPSESVLRIRWSKYWSFHFSISPSKEYSGLISFRIDWFDLLAVQGTLKSFLQHHRSKVSIL